MSEYSPSWKKPSDIMRSIRRRSNAKTKASESVKVEHQKRGTHAASVRSPNSVKRKNPFGCTSSASKYMIIENEATQNQESSKIPLFSYLDQSITATQAVPSSVIVSLDSESDQNKNSMEEKDISSNELVNSSDITISELESKIHDTGSKTIPSDWSLRTKARFTSSTPFSCSSLLSSADEIQGTMDFVRGTSVSLSEIQDPNIAKQQFQRHLSYWIHPNVPWLSLFPRITNSKILQTGSFSMNDDIRKAFYADWSESMNSAFQSVHTGICPYIYICGHQLTIIFRAAGASGTEVNAILTPTTKGLRESLKKEEINFSLPLDKQGDQVSHTNGSLNGNSQLTRKGIEESGEDKEENEEDYDLAEDSAVNWLEDLGLNRKQYRSVEPSRIRDQKDRFREIDHRPESTILVEGLADIRALFNYVLNCSSIIPSTGVHAGLPPTILSPLPFKGSTLKSIKVRHGNILRSNGQGQQQTAHSIEVTGPLLPHAVAGLTQLFSQTQKEFTASFSVHEPTIPFNSAPGVKHDSDNKTDNDDSSSHTPCMAFGPGVHEASLGRTAIRELLCEDGMFKWSDD